MKINIDRIKAAPWSRVQLKRRSYPYFLPLPILGDRTGDIESLSSYLCRQAEQLSELSHPFASRMLFSTLEKQDLPGHKKIPADALHACNGIGKYEDRFTKVVTIATDGKICASKMTLKPLEYLTDHLNHGLNRFSMNWCPTCWEEDLLANKTPYTRLYWTLQQTRVCAVHREKLIDLCPKCGASQQIFPTFPRQHVCHKCGHHLHKITSKQKRQSQSFTTEQEWFSQAIYSLIARVVSERRGVTQETLSRAMRRLLNAAQMTPDELAETLHADPRRIHGWLDKTRRCYFPAFIDMCYRIDIPPDQFLFDKDNLVNTKSWRHHPHIGYVTMTKLSSRQKDRIHSDLIKMLRKKEGPPGNIDQLASRYNVQRYTIRNNFPSLYKEVVARRSAWEKKVRKEAQQQNLETMIEGIFSLARVGVYPSERKLRDLEYVAGHALRKDDLKSILEAFQTFYKGHGFLDD